MPASSTSLGSRLIACAFFILCIGSTISSTARHHQQPAATSLAPSLTHGKLPLTFEANRGQTDGRVQYISHGRGYTLFLTGDEAVLKLSRDDQASVLHMKLVGANPSAQPSGIAEQPGKTNYFIGNDPKKWLTNVPNYSQVKYASAYPGVDLFYYGNQQQLEYDFVVSPGTDPHAITLDLGSSPVSPTRQPQTLRIAANGDLEVTVDRGEVVLHKPVVYQNLVSETPAVSKHFIDGRWVLKGDTQVGFEVSDYDRTRSLVIDPVLSYSSYIGGNNTDVGNGIKVDSAGNAYFAGRAQSTNFPVTTGVAQPGNGGGSDAFVTKVNASGTALIYSTYLGGSGADIAFGLALDPVTGNVFLAGSTSSTNFPTTTGAFQTTCGGGCTASGNSSVWVSQLNSTGSALVYSTYLDGSLSDEAIALGIAEDSAGEAYVTGKTTSSAFPTTPGSIQTTFGGGAQNAFVAKFNSAGTALVYSTYLGGGGTDVAIGITVDGSGNAYIAGSTSSPNFPTTAGAFQTTCAGSCTSADAFVAKINPAGNALVYSTFLGGSSADDGTAIAVDSAGSAYIAGFTCSTDLPTTTGAFQRVYGGGACSNSGGDAFVSKLNPAGSALVYSTYLGGSKSDGAFAIGLTSSGSAWVSGQTASSNFPVTHGAFQTAVSGADDVFVTELNATGSALTYSTYLGGTGTEVSYALTVDASGNPYVVGKTTSTDFPVTPAAFQTKTGGGTSDAFITKFIPGDQVWPLTVNLGTVSVGTTSAPLATVLSNSTSVALTISSISITGADATDFSQTNACGSSLAAGATCSISVTFTPSTAGVRTAAVNIVDGAPNTPQVVALSGTGAVNAVSLTPSLLTFSTQTVGTSSTAQNATLTNTGTSTVTIASIVATGPFTQTNTCGTTLAAAAKCMISVTFQPTASGTQTGAITVTDDGPNSPQIAVLTGVGTTMSLTPSSLSFGNQTKGTSSQPQTVTLKNVGTATITITKISITGSRVSSFSRTNTCTGTLAAGATCIASVVFTPQLKGALGAALTILDNAGGTSQNVPLSGTGQ